MNNIIRLGDDNDEQNVSDEQTQRDDMPTPVPPPPGLFEGKAPVGSITSPSETGRYRMVLRDYATTVQIEGSLVALDYTELNSAGRKITKTVLCQVSKMRTQNVHHENRLLGALLRQKGYIPGLSGFADNKEVDLLPMDTIITGTETHQLPRNIPLTGTEVRFASVQDVQNFSGKHPALFNIGYLYETTVPIGLMLKHFGLGDDGWGDAHMLGVFGATGSGKSVMAAAIIAGFAARHEMGMLIIDPQGQFSGFEMGKDPSRWSWRLDEGFRLAGRGPHVQRVQIEDIAFESPALFAHLLDRYDFFDVLGILGPDKKERTGRELALFLKEQLNNRDDEGITLGQLVWQDSFAEAICTMGAQEYADPSKQREKFMKRLQDMPYNRNRAKRIWEQVREKFDRPIKLGDLLDAVLINSKIVILNVNSDEELKDLYCSEILDGIKKKAETIYRIKQGQYWKGDDVKKYRDAQTNALIVIDEAHRFAPQSVGSNKDQERMVHTLVDAIRTTRKLSVGWCYITQSIASFNKDVFRQIQTKVLGVGIGTGADNDHLETAFNHDKDLIERYRSLPLPTMTGAYPYAVIGELVALGNGNRALFITATKNQQELIRLNPTHFKYQDGKPVPNTTSPSTMPRITKQLPNSRRSLPPLADDEDNLPF